MIYRYKNSIYTVSGKIDHNCFCNTYIFYKTQAILMKFGTCVRPICYFLELPMLDI